MTEKADFRSKKFTRDKERCHIGKRSLHQGDIVVPNVYAPNTEP